MFRISALSKSCDLCEVQVLLCVNVIIRLFCCTGIPMLQVEIEVCALSPRIWAQMAAEYVRLRVLSKSMLRYMLATIPDELMESKHRSLLNSKLRQDI
jgi:hypothetical protein